MIKFQETSAKLVQEKMIHVNKPAYLLEKQKTLDKIALEQGKDPEKAEIEKYEFLSVMDEEELSLCLLALLPMIKIDLTSQEDRCKYMIGTQSSVLLIKNNSVMIRVGGGFATLEEYIKQVGPFECIKIYKTMKGDSKRGTEPMGFKDAVVFYLHKHKTADKVIKNYISAGSDAHSEFFEAGIEFLRKKQEDKSKRWMDDATTRRSSVK